MPNTREKLIDLRQEAEKIAYDFCVGQEACDKCPYHYPMGCQEGMIADHLIANGVTLDNQVSSSKWIPVTERYPAESNSYICRCIVNDCEDMPFYMVLSYILYDKNPHFQHEGTGDMKVTHWMPLPPPPKAAFLTALISERDHVMSKKLAEQGIPNRLIEIPAISLARHLEYLQGPMDI